MSVKSDSAQIWIYFAIVLLGIWMFVTPMTFGFKIHPVTISNWVCGALLILLGLRGRRVSHTGWLWTIIAIGIWLQFTPLIFWAKDPAAYLNDTFVGVWIIFLALILYPLPGQLPDTEPSVPPGWSYSPSAWPARIVIAFLAFLCWMISRYLAAYQLGYIETVWDPFFDPGTRSVLESKVSKAFPVSDAGLGALAYTIEFISSCLGGTSRWRTAPWAVLIFGILVIPVSIVSIMLIILQPLAVGTWCTLCLATATLMLISIPFAISEVAATIQFLRRSKEKPFFSLLFQGGLCAEGTKYEHTPLESSIWRILKSACSGITFPWNLLASAIIGALLMGAPSFFGLAGIGADADPVIGALCVTVSVISLSEIVRGIRHLNAIIGILLLALIFLLNADAAAHLFHALAGILLIALSFRKGSVR